MQDRAAQLGDKVVYQIYVRSFNDSNGDGIGDLRGITQRLDYLKRLGVDYLWITPFFSSPQNDNGYDVADYRSVEPMFGTMEDFDELSREARARGIGLMLDMVFNHTSTSHEWFRRALAGDPRYLAYYKFVDAAPDATAANPGEPPTNWASKFGGSAWEYVPALHKWYLHLFDVSQADLNWDNPEVRAELADVVRFWKAKGVSGFRFDVVNLISKPKRLEDDLEGDGRRFYTDGPHVHEYLQELVREGGIEDMVTVGEMSSTSIENCIRYTAPRYHELTQALSFHHLKVDYAGGDKWALAEPDIPRLRGLLRDWQERMTAGGGWNALFWSNHDQPRPNSRFGDCSTRELWRRSSELLPVCTHLLRGTPYVYQGEELGMTNPDSVWSFYRRIIALRKECPVIQAGDVRFLDAASEKVIAYERTLGDAARGPRRLVVACNFGGTDAAALPAGEVEGGSVLIENCDEHRIQDGTLVLGPWCAVAFAW